MLVLDHLEIAQGAFRLSADLQIESGALTAVIGPSGAGKSTLLAAIAGFVAPVSGRILWEGRDLAGLAPGARPLSILFQEQNLFPHLDLATNLGLGLRADLRLTGHDRMAVSAALERVGLGGMERRRPATLSGGQQSRAALARALLRARPLMLFDEPFAALGPALRAEMLDLVMEIAAETGATVLMVSHDPADALRLAGLCVVVAEGRVLAPQPVAALLADPPAALRGYLVAPKN
ncbi:MAG: ATP-binding cassette domain-containing protein [Defluviimonas sp.]|uniref:thiamine ABC transporter ATP-binding protein n=1 Tax=Albidovulum sp. TaxID=1872424 RepID=UPI002A2A5D2B|nr:ATP-binding cassette domain-containing protein [Defluviimonas sp.]